MHTKNTNRQSPRREEGAQHLASKPLRDSRLELLRIVSMLLIVLHHYVLHGLDLGNPDYEGHEYYTNFLNFGAGLGINCFVLISGYFMVKSRITFRKIALLIGEVLFYSIAVCALFLIMGEPISTGQLIYSILPIHKSGYWFITTYLGLILLSPILNQALLSFSKKQVQTTIGLLLMLAFWIYPSSLLIWFILLYAIAAYIRLFIANSAKLAKLSISTVLATLAILTIVCCSLPIINEHLHPDHRIYSHLTNRLNYIILGKNSLYILIMSIATFIFFLHLKIRYNKWINIIAASTLGVYLIHDNYLVRPYLWHEILHTRDTLGSPYFFLYCFGSVSGVYIICTIIDYLRKISIEKIYICLLDKVIIPKWQQICAYCNKIATDNSNQRQE